MNGADRRIPLVAHVVHHFGTGGIENGIVNIINRMPPERFRHALVCLTDAGPFVDRIERDDIELIQLYRRPGHDFSLYYRLWEQLRALRPEIVHTRNLGALEAQIPVSLMPGVKRVHGEHGRDVFDIDGESRKYNLLRRSVRPLIQRYIAVSKDLATWLQATVGVSPQRIRQIYNGVAIERFHPCLGRRPALAPAGFLDDDSIIVGTVGRLAKVKDQQSLLSAFAKLAESAQAGSLRLVVVGDGELRHALVRQASELGIASRVWFAGDRSDVPSLMQMLDIFVLPSLGEGVSNTILEAMASGLPVVATKVGGNPELVSHGSTGYLVPAGRPDLLAESIGRLIWGAPELRVSFGRAATKVAQGFRWDRCVSGYLSVYDELLVGGVRSGISPFSSPKW